METDKLAAKIDAEFIKELQRSTRPERDAMCALLETKWRNDVREGRMTQHEFGLGLRRLETLQLASKAPEN